MNLRCPCGIDVHAHVVPETLPGYLGRRLPAQWPSMAPAHECHRHVMIAGQVYRTVSDRCWSASKRLADLETMGLSHQVLSPMPELLSYWLDAADAQPLLRYLNEQTAAMVAESAGRLIGLGAVPLQDIDMAIAELRHGIDVLVARLGASQPMLGTDYPFNFHDRTPVERVAAAGFMPEVAEQLVRGNAQRFLGLRVGASEEACA